MQRQAKMLREKRRVKKRIKRNAQASQGLEIVLELQGSIPVTLTGYSNGLPDLFASTITPRPAEFMPAPYDFRDPTIVHTSLTIEQVQDN